MKRAISILLLLAPTLAFGQRFQDVSQKDSPVSLGIAFYPGDLGPYVFAHNNSSKAVLAIVVAANFKDATTGQSVPVSSAQDYAFKIGPLKSGDQRGVAPVDLANFKTVQTGPNSSVTVSDDHPDPAKLKEATGEGEVVFVQFEDGTTWGNFADPFAKRLLDSRPQRLAYLKRLVDTYYESGQAAFDAVLREPKFGSPEFMTAGCLRGDAENDELKTIQLAKQRFADAQQWHSMGIF